MEPPRPARPQRLPREQRRAQLLTAAREVFAIKGYHNAAMDDIAEAAGVSKPVLYQHFASKLELYRALVDQACTTLSECVRTALASSTVNQERVTAAIGAFYDFVADSGRAFRFVFESDLTDAEVQTSIRRVHHDLAAAIGAVIAEDTHLPEQEAQLLGASLVGLAEVSARHWVTESASAISADQAAGLVASLIWGGIGSFPKQELA